MLVVVLGQSERKVTKMVYLWGVETIDVARGVLQFTVPTLGRWSWVE